MSRDAALLLLDMEDACEDVAAIMAGVDFDAFAASMEKMAAVERKIFVIGEAAGRLPEELRAANPHVPWKVIIGMRNILAHSYWRLDRRVLWDSATRSVPQLLVDVRAIRAATPSA